MGLKGHVFDKQLFGNEIYALFQDTFLDGSNGILPKFKAGDNREGMEAYTNSPVGSGRNLYVRNGVACICGRFVEETDAVNDLSNKVPSGSYYCILVIEIDLSKTNTTEELRQVDYKVLANANTYPTLTQQDIVNTNLTGVYQFELCRFKTNATVITEFSRANVNKLDIDSVYSKFEDQIQAKLDELDEEIATIDGGTLDKLKMYRLVNGYQPTCQLPSGWSTDYNLIEVLYGKYGNQSTLKSTGLLYIDDTREILCDSVENIRGNDGTYTVQIYSGKILIDDNNVMTINNQGRLNIKNGVIYTANNSTSGFIPELMIREVRLYKGYFGWLN